MLYAALVDMTTRWSLGGGGIVTLRLLALGLGLGKGRSPPARSAGKLPTYEYNKINYRRVSRQRPPVPGVLHSLVTKYTIVVY